MLNEVNGLAVYTIESPDGNMEASFVPEKGGVCSSLKVKHKGAWRELLYLHDFFWQKEAWHDLAGGLPFLFPICGRLERDSQAGKYLYDGKLYELSIHGFSWSLPWVVSSHTNNQIILCLEDTEETRSIYPFSFKITLTYRFEKNALICAQLYENKGKQPLPYYAGFHPYFLTPELSQGKSKVFLDYEPQRRFVYNQSLTDLVGEQDVFKTPVSILEPEINEQLTQLSENKKVTLTFPDEFKLSVEAKGLEEPDLFSYVQLYNIPEKPFFCVEPWMAYPNALNSVFGVRWLAPGKTDRGSLEIHATSTKDKN